MKVTLEYILQCDYEYTEERGYVGTCERPSQQLIKTIVPKQFEDEVKALCDYAGITELKRGMIIKMTLQEILTIIPKNRRRIESYKQLIVFLNDEMGVALELTSRKSKKHDGSRNERLLKRS